MDGSYTDIMTLAVKVDLFQTQSKRPSAAAVFFLFYFLSPADVRTKSNGFNSLHLNFA